MLAPAACFASRVALLELESGLYPLKVRTVTPLGAVVISCLPVRVPATVIVLSARDNSLHPRASLIEAYGLSFVPFAPEVRPFPKPSGLVFPVLSGFAHYKT